MSPTDTKKLLWLQRITREPKTNEGQGSLPRKCVTLTGRRLNAMESSISLVSITSSTLEKGGWGGTQLGAAVPPSAHSSLLGCVC